MKISYNWLKDYLQFEQTPEEVAEILTLTGLEVEEISQIGAKLDGVVVGEVLTAIQHPNADRLRICTVNTGNAVHQIVCGAPNVAVGQKVPVATIGTILPITLPDGTLLEIKKSKIRGEVSEGMICAEDELGLGDGHDGIMVLDDALIAGTPFSQVFDTNVDFVFEIGLTPNRPDASCHLGVARDLAAVLNKHLKKPFSATSADTKGGLKEFIDIQILNADKCHRYVGMLIRGVTIKASPKWLQGRLKAIGLRPINNVVDATNFVLHELGQPLHAFDYNLLAGKKIEVKSFDSPITFKTLDGTERNVPAGSLFICDGLKPVAIAGIMGGMNSEINEQTTDVLLESAYFDPVCVRKTSKQLALQTDSSYRFERGIDPNITYAAAKRCAALIADISGGTVFESHADVHPVITSPREIVLRLSRLNKLVGMEFRMNQAVSVLRSLEFEVRKVSEDDLLCTVPTFRPDVTEEIDLIEEVIRIFDYNKIPNPDYIQIPRPEILPFSERFLTRVKQLVTHLGFREIYANSLLPEAVALAFAHQDELIPTLNPISKDTAVLRPVLIPGLLRAAAFNFNRGAKSVQFFETGNVFVRAAQGTYHEGIFEDTHIMIGMGGLRQESYWNRTEASYTLHDLKSVVQSLFQNLRIAELVTQSIQDDGSIAYSHKKEIIGTLAQVSHTQAVSFDLSIPVYAAEFSLNKLQALAESLSPLVFKTVPKFPGIDFDLALLVDASVASGDIEQEIRKYAGAQLVDLGVFDVFEGKSIPQGKKSLGFRMRFQDESRTLTIKDVDAIITRVVKRLEKQFEARLRI
jgi:phenylalanyl-tRNA synthetase beta chain